MPYQVKLGVIISKLLFIMCLEDEYHDVWSATSLCGLLYNIFFIEKQFDWCINCKIGKEMIIEHILPSLWTCQKYDDIGASKISNKMFTIIIETENGFNLLIEEIIKYTETFLFKVTDKTSDNENIHENTSNLEFIEQLSVCIECLAMYDNFMSNIGNNKQFFLFCFAILVMLQNYNHPNISCLSNEFVKSFSIKTQNILIECINIQFISVPQDRKFLLLLLKAILRLFNLYIKGKNLISWWFLIFDKELQQNPYFHQYQIKVKREYLSISNIRIFNELLGKSMTSKFLFPKENLNYESNLKSTNQHALFSIICSYTIKYLINIKNILSKEVFLIFFNIILGFNNIK